MQGTLWLDNIAEKKQHGARAWRSIYQPTDLPGIILCSDPWMISSPRIKTKLKKNMTVTYSDDDSADPNNNENNSIIRTLKWIVNKR
jgi:hypothetical protein